jgi:hypothetical protein
MVLIRARLYGGVWDGWMASIDVKDDQDPPEVGHFGYSPRDPGGPAPRQIYRRAARDPWNSRVWDYVADTPEGSLIGHGQPSHDPFMTRRR